jgi:hypothetical protein
MSQSVQNMKMGYVALGITENESCRAKHEMRHDARYRRKRVRELKT